MEVAVDVEASGSWQPTSAGVKRANVVLSLSVLRPQDHDD
jgi:hypothetical protein